jgi:hypothetical protein
VLLSFYFLFFNYSKMKKILHISLVFVFLLTCFSVNLTFGAEARDGKDCIEKQIIDQGYGKEEAEEFFQEAQNETDKKAYWENKGIDLKDCNSGKNEGGKNEARDGKDCIERQIIDQGYGKEEAEEFFQEAQNETDKKAYWENKGIDLKDCSNDKNKEQKEKNQEKKAERLACIEDQLLNNFNFTQENIDALFEEFNNLKKGKDKKDFLDTKLTEWGMTEDEVKTIKESCRKKFTDESEMTEEQIAAVAILQELEIVAGYDDGAFRPNNPVNRAEAVKMINTAFEIEKIECIDGLFDDVNCGQWYGEYVAAAVEKNYVSGYDKYDYDGDGEFDEGNYFGPAEELNRAELHKMALESSGIAEFLNLKWENYPLADFSDEAWYAHYVQFIKDYDLGNSQQLEKKMTRIGFAMELVNIINLLEVIDDEEITSLEELENHNED